MTTPVQVPMPGDQVAGQTVVASVWITDGWPPAGMALVLTGVPGSYYRLVRIEHHGAWRVTHELGVYPNIVPAVEAYQQNGGDY